MKNLPNNKRSTNSNFKKISIMEIKNKRFNNKTFKNNNTIKKLSFNTYLNNTSVLDNSKQKLINTIKNFITETKEDPYSSISKYNTSPSHKSLQIKKNIYNLNKSNCENNSKKRQKIKYDYKNKNQNQNQQQLLLNSFTNYSKINKNYIRNILGDSLKSVPYSNIRSITEPNNNNNKYKYFNTDNNYIDFEYEIEKKLKKIELLKQKIKDLSNKIELIKYQINLLNIYFSQVNKQLLKVLYNSKTIKTLQNHFDKEIPMLKEDINDINNKINFITKENEMYDEYIDNIYEDIRMKQEEKNDVEFLNKNLYSEINNIKNKIVLIQSLNKNIKILLTKNKYY